MNAVITYALGAPLRIVGVAIGAFVVRWLTHRAIARIVARTVESRLRERLAERRRSRVVIEASGLLGSERRRQRAETIGSVLRSIASFVIFGTAFVTVLDELGIPIGPLLASAGVAGVALGFGAQSLVRDFLSGIFMILEDQYGVGDVIDTGDALGTVEEVSLRVTRLRDGTGVVWYVRNGEILRVGNHSQGWSTGVVDVAVDSSEDIAKVQELIRATALALDQDEAWSGDILLAPTVAPLEPMTGASVTVRVTVKCTPHHDVDVRRELLERITVALDREGIRVPVPADPSAGFSGPV